LVGNNNGKNLEITKVDDYAKLTKIWYSR